MQTVNTSFQPAALPELREKLESLDRADQPSVGDVLACMHEVMELAQQVASSFEEAGHLAAAAAVYEDAATAFQKASQKVSEKDRALLAPLVDYWLYTARLKRDLVPKEAKPEKAEEPSPPRPERTVSVQRPWRPEELIEQIKAPWREEKVITARDVSEISPGQEEMAFGKAKPIKKKGPGRWVTPPKEDTSFKR
ncbi:MAG: hypothetical protein QHJ81_14855 [Anaerolineae bacterium]|nr:hypothetical protein [Anaerolineae bacterium]